MQVVVLAGAFLGTFLQAEASASPVGKVLSMISDLQAKVVKEGEASQKEYAEFTDFCEERSRNLGFEIKTAESEVEELSAAIEKEAATLGSLRTRIEELAADLATNEADLKAATTIRGKEASDFAAEDKELMETLDMLRRASAILEREMQGGASMLQLRHAGSLIETLSVMVQSSLIGTSDGTKLAAFVQASQEIEDGEGDTEMAPGAPHAAAYESQSGRIVETLEALAEKAEGLLAEARQKETTAAHNFEMLKQSLEDEIKFATKDMDEAKAGVAGSEEKKAVAEGDLRTTQKDLAESIKAKKTLHQDCMTKSESYAAEVKSRNEELKALAAAKQAITEATGGAAALDQVSLLQRSRSRLSSSTDLKGYEAVRFVSKLAQTQHSHMLAQLASRMSTVLSSGDPFGKVKGLISEMIAKLEEEAGADATKKAYCDKELKESKEKKADKTEEIETLSTKIEQMSAASAKLKEEVASLESELSKIAKSQAEMDKLRQEEKDAYAANKAELEKGLEGMRLALKILGEYYGKDDKAHEADEGAASGILGLLETIEADMTQRLAEITSEEEQAIAEYEQVTKENEIEKATKEQDVKYKTKESKELDKTAAEHVADRKGVQSELDAVLEYLSRIEAECIAKAETYAERKERRNAEIVGLKQALEILQSETALVQRSALRRLSLRGHVAARLVA